MNERIRIIELIGDWLINSFYEKQISIKIHQVLIGIFLHMQNLEIWQKPI